MPIITLQPYDRASAVAYAHRWAYGRNPRFYDYEDIGGDCTNFASQCVLAGGAVMNFTPDYGWYYIDANKKSPSWTGVPYFFDFMTREERSVGPVAMESRIVDIMPGDVVQLSFDGENFTHTPVVVAANRPQDPSQILVAAHTYDSDNRPLSTYEFKKIRYLHVVGILRPGRLLR